MSSPIQPNDSIPHTSTFPHHTTHTAKLEESAVCNAFVSDNYHHHTQDPGWGLRFFTIQVEELSTAYQIACLLHHHEAVCLLIASALCNHCHSDRFESEGTKSRLHHQK